eukprot:scpid106049/ scgid16875/ 
MYCMPSAHSTWKYRMCINTPVQCAAAAAHQLGIYSVVHMMSAHRRDQATQNIAAEGFNVPCMYTVYTVQNRKKFVASNKITAGRENPKHWQTDSQIQLP